MSFQTIGATTPWSNEAEREIKELKKGTSHKMLLSRAPEHMWEACSELKHILGPIYKFDGEVLEKVMSGKTSNISKFFKLEWFQWVMFGDETAPFPDDVLKLGHYLEPSIYVDPAITTKILT